MKTCNYCGTRANSEKEQKCAMCGATEFTYKCDTCGSEFDGSACKVCYNKKVSYTKSYAPTAQPKIVYVPYQPQTSPAPKETKKKHTFWWVIGWVFCFPIPLSILIGRSKMGVFWKVALIMLVWSLFISLGADTTTESQANTEPTQTAITYRVDNTAHPVIDYTT